MLEMNSILYIIVT